EIVDLAVVALVLWNPKLESPRVLSGQMIFAAAFGYVLRLVGKQMFDHRQRWRRHDGSPGALFLGQPDAIVERAQPRALRNAFDPLDLLRRHEFATFVAGGDEVKLGVELLPLGVQLGAQRGSIT